MSTRFKGLASVWQKMLGYFNRKVKLVRCTIIPRTRGLKSDDLLIKLLPNSSEFSFVENIMIASIGERKNYRGNFNEYRISGIYKNNNKKVFIKYQKRCQDICQENNGESNEMYLFHGSRSLMEIIVHGFDERFSEIDCNFGGGVYFALNSSNSNQYCFGFGQGCPAHKDVDCYICERSLLLCRVSLGRSVELTSAKHFCHPPRGHHSVTGKPPAGGLTQLEYVVYRGEQAFPEYLINYQIMKPK